MKKLLKGILIFIVLLLLAGFIATKVMSKDLPQGKVGVEAEALADKMLTRMNKPAWDSLEYISWTFFRGGHHYVWDKQNNMANIQWDGHEVILDLDNVKGPAYRDGNILQGEKANNVISTAWSYWCNDSFWLYAPYKLKDEGITRSIVQENGKEGLLVTYNSGGATPGDSYLWWVDDTGLPTSYDMWTSIIPIQGLNSTWTNWADLPGGAMIAKTHSLGPTEMSLSNIKAGSTIESIGQTQKIFSKK